MKKLLIMISAIALLSCTENARVKNFGGTGTIEIPSNEKFVNVTWKNTELWVVTKERSKNDTSISTYYFKEKSSFGVIQGTYIIKEK